MQALELPVLVLHQQYRTYQVCDLRTVGEDADVMDAIFYSFVNAPEEVGA